MIAALLIIVVVVLLLLFVVAGSSTKSSSTPKTTTILEPNLRESTKEPISTWKHNLTINDNDLHFCRERDFTAIDFETATGIRNSICQIGICRVKNGEIVYKNSILVQPPGNEYSKFNIQIHGIRPSMTKNEPFFLDVWNEIKPLIEDQLVIAHNTDFDVDCLRATLNFYYLPFPVFETYCTYKSSGLGLADLTESLDVELLKHHDALADATACAECFMKLRNGQIPDSSKITQKQKKSTSEFHERISGDDLKPDLENADPNSPFYNKKVVVTGVFSIHSRDEIKIMLKKAGADINNSISRKTDFVLIGESAGYAKLDKIQILKSEGVDIKELDEEQFISMVKDFV